MHRRLVWLLVVSIARPVAIHAQQSTDDKTLQVQVLKVINDRLRLYQRSDTAGYRRMVTRGAVYVNDDGSLATADEHIAMIGKKPSSTLAQDVTELHVARVGDIAMVDYLDEVHESAGPHEFQVPLRMLEVFTLRNNRWLLTRSSQVPQKQIRWQQVAAVDSATLDDYVGRYEDWPGHITTITRRGMQLYLQATGDSESTAFNASSADTFFLIGDASLNVFTRDRSGRVTGFVTNWTNGQLIARRLP